MLFLSRSVHTLDRLMFSFLGPRAPFRFLFSSSFSSILYAPYTGVFVIAHVLDNLLVQDCVFGYLWAYGFG
jgi:hypothetical protein